jgi:hypothetical protein
MLTIDGFFEALSGSEGRYELAGGMAYAIEGHNVICSNVLTALVPAGKQKGCRTTSIDMAVQTDVSHISRHHLAEIPGQ